jgi:phage shock protein A
VTPAAASLLQALRAELAALDQQIAAARHTADALAATLMEEDAAAPVAEEPPRPARRWLGDQPPGEGS